MSVGCVAVLLALTDLCGSHSVHHLALCFGSLLSVVLRAEAGSAVGIECPGHLGLGFGFPFLGRNLRSALGICLYALCVLALPITSQSLVIISVRVYSKNTSTAFFFLGSREGQPRVSAALGKPTVRIAGF